MKWTPRQVALLSFLLSCWKTSIVTLPVACQASFVFFFGGGVMIADWQLRQPYCKSKLLCFVDCVGLRSFREKPPIWRVPQFIHKPMALLLGFHWRRQSPPRIAVAAFGKTYSFSLEPHAQLSEWRPFFLGGGRVPIPLNSTNQKRMPVEIHRASEPYGSGDCDSTGFAQTMACHAQTTLPQPSPRMTPRNTPQAIRRLPTSFVGLRNTETNACCCYCFTKKRPF